MRNPRWLNHSPLRQHVGPTGVAKRWFATEEEAMAYAGKLNEGPTASKRRPYVPYRCDTCDRFHAGRRSA